MEIDRPAHESEALGASQSSQRSIVWDRVRPKGMTEALLNDACRIIIAYEMGEAEFERESNPQDLAIILFGLFVKND